jgi:xanthine dehydrogenase accessory factor
MICGGELEIHLELFPGGDASPRALIKRIVELRPKGIKAILATLLDEGPSGQLRDYKFLYVPGEDQPFENPTWIAPFQKEFSEVLSKGQPVLLTAAVQGKERKVFLEPIISPPDLFVFGAGHVSAALCPLAKRVGFQVTVFDDRAEFADPGRFPDADDIVVRPFDRISDHVNIGPYAFVVIMTRGHLHDHQVLRQVLKNPPRYIGMIGSRHKRGIIFEALKQEDFSEDLIKAVHTPIGLDIQAETPEEIAVSIVAELIQVRNQSPTVKKSIKGLPQ